MSKWSENRGDIPTLLTKTVTKEKVTKWSTVYLGRLTVVVVVTLEEEGEEGGSPISSLSLSHSRSRSPSLFNFAHSLLLRATSNHTSALLSLSLSLSLRPRFSSFSSVGALSNRVRGGRAASEAVVWGRPFDWNYKSGTGSRVCLFRFCLLLFPWFVLVLWFVVVRLPGLLAAEWVNQPARSPTPASTHLLLNTLSCATDIDRSNNIGRWRTLETVLITKCKQTCPYTFYLNHLKVKQFGFETPLYYAGLSRDRDHRTLCALSNSNGERRRETPVERGRKFRVFTLFAWQASNLEFLLKCLQ